MKYENAEVILPDSLIREIQKYTQGKYIYIPCQGQAKKRWGEASGNRALIQSRNEDIRNKHRAGRRIGDLAEEFFLSIESIKKIVYSK